jgi:hypothetical protein
MAFVNESWSDRIVRVAMGLVFLYLGWGDWVPGWLGVELIAIGAFALVTGVIGWCPMYAWFGRRTRSRV